MVYLAYASENIVIALQRPHQDVRVFIDSTEEDDNTVSESLQPHLNLLLVLHLYQVIDVFQKLLFVLAMEVGLKC